MTALQARAILAAVIVLGTEPMSLKTTHAVSCDGLDGVPAEHDAPLPAVLLFVRIFDADDREEAGNVCLRILLDGLVELKGILFVPSRNRSEVVELRLQGLEGLRGP